jgi:GntP family gluconate:H+ symporter
MGAAGAMVLAIARKRLDLPLLRQALDSSARLSIFVLFVLVGSTVFSLTFQAINGPHWVENLFKALPGGALGFLIFVNAMIFVLGCFIDFFEITFIVLPLLLPVADKLGIDLIFFGVMIALNLQTSFLTPPFGFALFYLRSVAAKTDYTDKVTGARIAALKTGDIYKGSIAFVVLQVIMVVAVVAKPSLVTGALQAEKKVDVEKVNLNITAPEEEEPPPSMGAPAPAAPKQ